MLHSCSTFHGPYSYCLMPDLFKTCSPTPQSSPARTTPSFYIDSILGRDSSSGETLHASVSGRLPGGSPLAVPAGPSPLWAAATTPAPTAPLHYHYFSPELTANNKIPGLVILIPGFRDLKKHLDPGTANPNLYKYFMSNDNADTLLQNHGSERSRKALGLLWETGPKCAKRDILIFYYILLRANILTGPQKMLAAGLEFDLPDVHDLKNRMEKRAVIKIYEKLGKSSSETYQLMKQVYGDSCLSRSNVFVWHKCFLDGKDAVEEDPRSRRLISSRTPGIIEEVRNFVANDRFAPLKMMADS
ncbi:protein GVQW3 [Trichonephila clavipes]|nr:protein GVQW3 [Trichonephila clavipes]